MSDIDCFKMEELNNEMEELNNEMEDSDNETDGIEDFDNNDNEKIYENGKYNLIDGVEYYSSLLPLIPPELKLSTITITCSVNRSFIIGNIVKYFDYYDEYLIYKYNDNVKYSANGSEKIKQKKIKKNNFSNQVSFIFDTYKILGITDYTKKKKYINAKLFHNGSIQMTGCKHMSIITKCAKIIIDKITIPKNVDGKLINFIDDNNVTINDIDNFNVCMINANSNLNYNVNLEKCNEMFNYLKKNNKYPKIISNKYDFKRLTAKCFFNSNISYFIFETGSINLSGNNILDLINAFYFLNKQLYSSDGILSNPISPSILLNLLLKEL
jgi:hypothetical protein